MCGRFTLTLNIDEIKEAFDLSEVPILWNPNYNIAPAQPVLMIKSRSKSGELISWGINRNIKNKNSIIINIRRETLLEGKAFTGLFKANRCIIPMNGFFEWKKEGKLSFPHYFQFTDRQVTAFAGLWSKRNTGNKIIEECAILTCPANELVGKIHTRMPVILGKDGQSDWLSNHLSEKDLLDLLQSYPNEKMTAYAVTPEINNVFNNSPDHLKPFVAKSEQMKLDL
jgi:putative SOS response-associated peptidase YedK